MCQLKNLNHCWIKISDIYKYIVYSVIGHLTEAICCRLHIYMAEYHYVHVPLMKPFLSLQVHKPGHLWDNIRNISVLQYMAATVKHQDLGLFLSLLLHTQVHIDHMMPNVHIPLQKHACIQNKTRLKFTCSTLLLFYID